MAEHFYYSIASGSTGNCGLYVSGGTAILIDVGVSLRRLTAALKTFGMTPGELDALVVDPPRAGLADGVVASIAAASPRRVAYVSCDASTWARDVARFEQEGYRLIRVTPVDLFPQTYHVEVVSIFERSGS